MAQSISFKYPKVLSNDMVSDSYKEHYMGRFRDYTIRINATSEPFDPENAYGEVRLKTKDGKEYETKFITLKYLSYLFEKNKKTGENAAGTFSAIPGVIHVDEITEDSIKITIDKLIERLIVEKFFEEIN